MRYCLKVVRIILITLILISTAFTGDIVRFNPAQAAAKNDLFSIITWELTKLPEKWSHKINMYFKSNTNPQSQRTDNIYRYFSENNNKSNEVSKQDIEISIEELISDVIKREGLTYFGTIVFPPLSITLDSAPNVLITSPRDKIQRGDEALLKPDLLVSEMADIENELFIEENLSSLVIPVGGIATYPVIIDETGDLLWALQTAAHEWMHTFLFFKPLGFNMFESPEMQTLNETVASLAGKEIGLLTINLLMENYPSKNKFCKFLNPPASVSKNEFDFSREMKATRIQADKLLSEGRIEEAERYMENRRMVFNSNGYPIRKLNQAYFAFYGTYAESPASTSIIGEQVRKYRSNFEGVGNFIKKISQIGTYDEFVKSLEDIDNKIENQYSRVKNTHSTSTVIPFICE